jgi:hypothetical protein
MLLKKTILLSGFFLFFLSNGQTPHTLLKEELIITPQVKAPCDLKKISEKKELPTIKIYGERHSSPESQKLNENLTLEARRGQCVVGLEGVLCSNSQHILKDYIFSVTHREPIPGDQNRFFGIEDEISYCLAILFKNHTEAKKYQQQGNLNALAKLISKIKKDLDRYPFLREAFENFKKQETDQGFPHRSKLFIKYLSNNFKEQPQESQKNIEKNLNEMLQELPQSLEAFTLSLIETLKSKKTSRHVPANLEKLAQDYFKSGDDSLVKKTVALEWRNLIFAENILKQYCQALSKEKAPNSFDIVVGNLHVAGIEKLLKENFEGPLSTKILTSYSAYNLNKAP